MCQLADFFRKNIPQKNIVQRSYVMNQKGAIKDARSLGTP